ncbi:calponin domain protein [Teratosphaeria destructans]|uniref:Calponin domain protein n=1 Tax=Teratosphaeria destructans TaxID=418781 RepID=A0A9W7SUH5_9PEZI|nr:calponin domain protein [Teratosphaeria destructans]
MASVTSLDQDVKALRLSRYSPHAANEARQWVEETLGDSLPPGDLLEALRDGVALCRLANMALPPPGIKFKQSQMPFMQMENISHFLKACEMPPLNLPAHDRFLTVDLYEAKDPAQVLQCLGAFSRKAHAADPSRFKKTIGPKKQAVGSPSVTGGAYTTNGTGSLRGSPYGRPRSPTKPSAAMPPATRAMSPALTGGSTGSQSSNTTRSPGTVSSWSTRKDEGITSPAWNIHQYGYMGGASQGNQGISFGARRQITSQTPSVPSLAEKERQRKEKQAEEARLQQQAEEAEYKRRVERDAEEEREKIEEERRWEEETRRQREEERRRVEEQKRQWEEQERRWKEEEEVRRKEDAELQASLKPKVPDKPRVPSSTILRGQTLSQYQREQASMAGDGVADETPEQKRVRELEKQLEEARERERQYQAEREERLRKGTDRSRPNTADRPSTASSAHQSEASWAGDEREYLRSHWQNSPKSPFTRPTPAAAQAGAQRPLPSEPASTPMRPLPQPVVEEVEDEEGPNLPTISSPPQFDGSVVELEGSPALPTRSQPLRPSDSASSIPSRIESAPHSSPLGSANRPLPTPDKEFKAYSPEQAKPNRTDQFLSANKPPPFTRPRISSSQEAGDTSLEQQRDRDRRIASQQKTQAGGWASKSLLEREMERERERQREWEANQQSQKDAPRDPNAGTGQGQSWDVNQYGYMGGDGMNRGSSTGSGINFGGRRQIIGPRPQK